MMDGSGIRTGEPSSDIVERPGPGLPFSARITPAIRNQACRDMQEAAREIARLRQALALHEERLPSPKTYTRIREDDEVFFVPSRGPGHTSPDWP